MGTAPAFRNEESSRNQWLKLGTSSMIAVQTANIFLRCFVSGGIVMGFRWVREHHFKHQGLHVVELSEIGGILERFWL